MSIYNYLLGTLLMPHLSPIRWIIALVSFWLTLIVFVSAIWWLAGPKFSVINIYSSHESKLNWKWLQDGWGHKL